MIFENENTVFVEFYFPSIGGALEVIRQLEVPSVFRLPKGGFHAICYS